MEGFVEYVEGETKLIVPEVSLREHQPPLTPAFFNPKGAELRDLSVLAFLAYRKLFRDEVNFADPLTGVGAKALRLLKEAHIDRALVNDLNPTALKALRKAAELNGVSDRMEVHNEEANLFLLRLGAPGKRPFAIDIDPFGSPIPFMDSALKVIADGGMLSATATDTAVLSGLYQRVALRRYFGTPSRDDSSKETGLRLLLSAIIRRAAALDLYARPLFCHSTRHYMRCYVLVGSSALKADETLDMIGDVFYCANCGYKSLKPRDLCPICGGKVHKAGPIYIGQMHDEAFLKAMLEQGRFKKHEKTLKRALDEIRLPPYFHSLSWVCDHLQIGVPSPDKVIEELKKMGFDASRSSLDPVGVKTDAPYEELLSVLKSLS